jgi:Tfp pilus assembly protein PilX
MRHAGSRLDERGAALPLVLAVTLLVFLLIAAGALHAVNHRRHQLLDWEMLRAQYAAEAGIAVVQARLREDPEWTGAMTMTWDGIRVRTVVEGRTSDGIRLRSVGRTSGVKQTIRVALDPETLAVKRWER